MLLPQPPKADPKGSPENNATPGFPTEGSRDLAGSTPASTSPILTREHRLSRRSCQLTSWLDLHKRVSRFHRSSRTISTNQRHLLVPVPVRRISLDDKAKVKAYSMENDKAGWLQKKLFKKEVAWPRELYLSVLGCKAIVAPSQSQRSRAPASRCAESETTTASVTTEGDGDRDAGGAGSGGSGAIDPETATPGVSNPETVAAAGVSNNNPETAAAAGVSEGVGSGVAGNGDVGRKAGADEAATSTAEESGGKEGGEVEEAGEGEGGGGGGGDGAASSEGEGKGWADGAGDFDEEAEDGGVGCFVRIRNATTGRDLQTQVVEGSANPGFHETFVVPCQGPRDAVVLELHFGKGDQIASIGEAALPLDARVVGVSHPVLLSVKDKQGRSRGFLRVEAFWMDEAKPRKETGEFYYRVVHPRGVSLRNLPSMTAERSVNVMEFGEVFVACERQWLVGDGECTVFVKVLTAKDRWARTGWCFESYCQGDEKRTAVLERTSSPRKETGRFFYRVSNANGTRLYSKPDAKSKLRKEVLPEGQVLESSEKWTPAGSPVTFVTVDNERGFIVQKCGRKIVRDAAGTMALEEIDCPKSTTVSSVGVGVAPGPRALSPPGRARLSRASSSAGPNANANASAAAAASSGNGAAAGNGNGAASSANAAGGSVSGGGGRVSASLSPQKMRAGAGKSAAAKKSATAAAAAVRRLYRVRVEGGVQATRTPDIMAPIVDLVGEGTAFYGNAEVVKRYEGIGDVAFVMRETDKLWVRANRPGLSLLLDCFTNAVEAGAFTYRVSHENGVVVRTAPGLDAPPVKPRRILPVTKLVNVCERLTRAEDILAMSRPPIFLRLAGNDGWVFDRRGHTLVCEDVTVKSRIATANAITAEAARLTL